MKFNWAKGDRDCRHCRQKIARGESQVHISIPPRKTTRGYWLHYYYHTKCYLQYLEYYIGGWFLEHPNDQKKLGRRKVITHSRNERRRLMALYRYHRSKGNIARMMEVEKQIEQISYGMSPYFTDKSPIDWA